MINIEYFYQEMPTDSIELESAGNTYLQANNDSGDEWYLGIKTDLGWTTVKQYGPLTIDMDNIGYSFNYNYSKFEYNEKKLYKIIYDFLNDKRRLITQAQEIDADTFQERLENLYEQD